MCFQMTSAQTNNQQGFPPPVYQRPGNFPMQRGHSVRTNGPQYAMANSNMNASQQQQLLLQQQQQQRKLLQQQQEQQKRRLLQAQQQQQLLIPSNVQAVELNTGLQNIDSLLNHTVAPNVTLQRSSSVPDSQLSPGYGSAMMNVNNGSQNQRQPYSPHSQLASPLGQQQGYPQTTVNNFQQSSSRLSPHPPFQQQMSPRQGYPQAQNNSQQGSWSQQQATNRMSLQQQQNPMLNAQLTVSFWLYSIIQIIFLFILIYRLITLNILPYKCCLIVYFCVKYDTQMKVLRMCIHVNVLHKYVQRNFV